MTDSEVIPLLIRMCCSFLAAVPAIALWSKSREASWMLMVFGALLNFVDSLYAVLAAIGLATYRLPFAENFPLLQSLLAGIPSLLFAAGFLVFLLRRRRY